MQGPEPQNIEEEISKLVQDLSAAAATVSYNDAANVYRTLQAARRVELSCNRRATPTEGIGVCTLSEQVHDRH